MQPAAASILIAGAGPTGLSLAVELARRGVQPRVVEKAKEPINEPRALGLSVRTLEVMDAMGVIGPVLDRGKPVQGFTFWDRHGARMATIPFALDELPTPYPSELLLPQSETQRFLLQRLEALGGHVDFGVDLTGVDTSGDGAPSVTLRHADGNEEVVRPDWLVGADGASSRVRQVLSVPFEGAEYAEHFLLADVAIRWDLDDAESHVFFLDEGTVFAFSYPEPGRWRLVDTSGKSKTGDTDAAMQRFRHLFAEAGVASQIDDPTWISLYTVHRRIAASMRPASRVFLLGDAAHVHSPVSGQGLNTGIQDAFNLGWKLALASRNQASETLLDSFQAERQPVARSVLDSTDGLTKIIVEQHGLKARVRDLALKALTEFSFVGRRFTRMSAKLDLAYRDSPAVLANGSGKHGAKLQAGDRAPTLAPGSMASGHGELLPFLRTPRHTLLVFADEGNISGNDKLTRAVAAHAEKIELVVVPGTGTAPACVPNDNLLPDPTGALHRAYEAGNPDGSAFLIRPDGYLGLRAPADTAAEHVTAYFDRLCNLGSEVPKAAMVGMTA